MHTALVFGGRSIPCKTGTLEALGLSTTMYVLDAYQLQRMF